MNRSDQSQKPKKRFSGGLLLLILAAILTIFTIQNFTNEKKGKVSFSYQVEHLVNLDLLRKDESRKVAQNDNLVTFTGKFRERLPEEAKARYRYLDLLAKCQEYREGKGELSHELASLQREVVVAAEHFLALSGLPIPQGGYVVVSPSLDTLERENGIIVYRVPMLTDIDLASLEAEYPHLISEPIAEDVRDFGQNIEFLIENFRSPILGIGRESLKRRLRDVGGDLSTSLKGLALSPQELLPHCQVALRGLREIVNDLDREEDHIRLRPLRSVRNYLIELEQLDLLVNRSRENDLQLDRAREKVADATWFFNNRELSTKALEKQAPEEFKLWFAQAKKEWERFPANRGMSFKVPDQPRNLVLERTFKSEEPSPNYFSYIFLTLLPVLLLLLLLYFVFSRQMKEMGSGAMSFGKSPARMLNKSTHQVTFRDVAGVEEAEEELWEIVDFLKDPMKFTALGARIPKGVLLVGPPGTGKTLIAKAVAGEADRPFFSISGSDFVEMFVGVGASRIRDLFEQAKKNAPCIIFIDEIDAVGRRRGAGIGGGHDEREQTLNQLLVEMDGFNTNEGVILMAATNRPDVLDQALLRPGRFDRQVVLDLPDIKGRFEILKVHARKIKLDHSVDLMDIARATSGNSGADLMNILNEAALLAARRGHLSVTASDAFDACDKVRYGKERRSLEIDEKEKLHTAYHESGHAVVGFTVERADPIEKVTIIPRGLSLGATYFVPEKNRLNYWRKELIDRLAVLMGGRVAESLFIGDISSGAQMDISQATQLARNMVCQWGMAEALGPVSYDEQSEEKQYFVPSATKIYSDETAKQIDFEVRRLLGQANKRAAQIIEEKSEKVELMAQMLLEFEVLDKADVRAILDGSWSSEAKRKKLEAVEEAKRDDLSIGKGKKPRSTPFDGGSASVSPSPQSV